ncbi:alpha/beta hydrolase family protein [Pseudomonas aeruginosa]|jgi:fermentation-respiration switch protein FrsA (DUF1100 family)|uniref:alpha/beta hydrolase family protein n=1 Tax=Pseudomonas aeruginosa TaxID=287 RepID=UPI000BA170CF|nr:alpha/beta hydrolase [Pseudomonas aeruginosa]EIU1321626.1 alpha/beta hydrolase [Pseudomonas aeruginosa]EKV6491980.1 alpha/beta hydrolase [Pseudomonas aeruginosa]ELY3880522.1 alpha/beta hydrolase [Pseudomonas aeruginosa]MCO2110206.1 alpha/beta hydrolase [Pseudomonas aeruginosa]MDV8060217.1 alpha/beta hydrolase [Pseudomonas aeruginosa]
MFEYFPGNYVWNLSTNIALGVGGNIGEVDRICRQLVKAAQRGDDKGTDDFFRAWCGQADQLCEAAGVDEQAGRRLSAGAKYGRASVYYMTAERMQPPGYPPRKAVYQKMLDSFADYLELHEEKCTRVLVPFRDKEIAGLFVPADRPDGSPAPCVVLGNGLDSTKEMIYGSGIQQALAQRGIASISVDHPGVGEALRLQGLTALVESEIWAGAVIDYLETRADVDASMLGICAWSLGGYYAPRAAAMEKRLKLCVAWGANFDWGEMQKRRLAREGDQPVPHYWNHVQWVWGCKTQDEFMAFSPAVTLAPVIEKIEVPFLVTHGSNDRQIPLEYAYKQYDGAVNSPKRELKIFMPEDGGVEHCSADNLTNARDYIADWISVTFHEIGAQGVRT